jgi:hypothetical protein
VFNFVYPKVKRSLGKAALQDPYPAWFLDPHGVITAANLMAFWLWDALTPGEPVQPDALLGTSIFTIQVRNLKRIPIDRNIEFFTKRAAMVKHVNSNSQSPHYAPFIEVMHAHPGLAYIYENVPAHPDNEWEYPLWIAPPEANQSSELLKFLVTNYRLEGDSGFLVTYTPDSATLPTVEEQYSILMRDYGEQRYVVPDDIDQTQGEITSPKSFRSLARTYYPAIIQDPLWYITEDNKAQQLLVGRSTAGAHFFEMLFDPQLQQWMGPIQETTGPRAVRYFETFTESYRQENHDLHNEYVKLLERLSHNPEFPRMLDLSRKLKPHLNLPENPGAPFYSCRVILPWSLSFNIMLHFRSMAQLLYEGLLVHTDEPRYQVTLVPEDSVTEVALMLLYLAFTAPKADDPADRPLKQLLWLLAILQTVQEALSGNDEQMSHWEPDVAFARIYTDVNAAFSRYGGDVADQVIEEIRNAIKLLEDEYMLKEELPTLLEGFLGSTLYAGLNLRESVEPVLKRIYP